MAEETEKTEKTEKKEKKVEYTVLPSKLGGGPCGLGDPNDKSLRKVETDVLIKEKIRKKTRTEKCKAEFTAFGECAKESGFSMVFNCRKENTALKECAKKWWYDEKFVAECTQEYLDERSEYRRTGITRRQKEHRSRIGSNM